MNQCSALSPFSIWGPAHLGVPLLFTPSLLTVCGAKVANQAHGTLCGPHFLSLLQNPSLRGQWDKRGLDRSGELVCWGGWWRCIGQGVTVELPHSPSREVNGELNGSLPLPLSLWYRWREGSHCGLWVKVHWDNGDLKAQGLPLKARKEPSVFSCAMGCVGTPGLLNALFESALGQRDKETQKEKVNVWEEMGVRAVIDH